MGFGDKCEECKDNLVVFACMVEGDEDWTKTEVKYLCENCQHKLRKSIIETWTKAEWDEDE